MSSFVRRVAGMGEIWDPAWMGLGVYYRAELPERFLSPEGNTLDQLWEEASAVVARLTSELGSPIADWFWSHGAGEQLWIQVVPFEENVELRVEEGAVVFSAKTSGAGPGYHQFVVGVLDGLEQGLGLRWTFGEGEGDETGFREGRDVNQLEREMAVQARALAQLVLEQVGSGALLNMGFDLRPVVRGFAASPLGEWSKEWFERVVAATDAELVSEVEPFFPWWNGRLSGDEFAKFGLVVCWNDVRWVPPEGEREAEAVHVALHCFERARALGTRVELPELAWAELKRLAAPGASEVAPGPDGLGYRRRTLTVNLSGGWELDVPGYFHEAIEDEGGTLVYWFGDRTLRVSTISFGEAHPAHDRLEQLLEGKGEPLGGLPAGMAGNVQETTDDDDGCLIAHVVLATTDALCSLSFAYLDENDREWALETAHRVRHRSG